MHLTPNMYKIVTLRHMLRTLLLENAFDTKYVQNRYLAGKCKGNRHCKMCLTPNIYKIIIWRQMIRKSLLENAFGTTYVQNCYYAGKCQENHYCKMCLTPNMYKIVTLNANAKKIITVKCMWHHICANPLLWWQMLRKSLCENAFDA